MGVSKNNGTPESWILIGFSIINHPFWALFLETAIYQGWQVEWVPLTSSSWFCPAGLVFSVSHTRVVPLGPLTYSIDFRNSLVCLKKHFFCGLLRGGFSCVFWRRLPRCENFAGGSDHPNRCKLHPFSVCWAIWIRLGKDKLFVWYYLWCFWRSS